MLDVDFTDEQKRYLEGFTAGSGMARSLYSLPVMLGRFAGTPVAAPAPAVPATSAAPAAPARPEDLHREAQDRFLAAGKKLVPEEQAKRKDHGLDLWDKVLQHARDKKYPKGTDVFMFKFQGIFYVAPAQDSFMCRLRFAGGLLNSYQMRGLADLAEQYASPHADCTTRANLQFRQITAENTVNVLTGLVDLGIVIRGAGADNIRNVTASPTAGIDLQELIDTRALARQMHHYILNHREMYGLPRKFNIAFDGGGAVSALEDTNDIGFTAVRVGEKGADAASAMGVEPGVYFRFQLGGITGHKDFARDTGLLLKPEQCVAAAAAAVRVFTDHGDRTDRRKARLKYVLDAKGFEWFLGEMQKHLDFTPARFPLDQCDPRPEPAKHGHVGFHAQKQPGLFYVGVVLPVGRMTVAQMRGLASIADKHGSGSIRLTVWQNLILPDIPQDRIDSVKAEIEAMGLHWSATAIRAGLIACTGNAGCKFAAANTKKHAMQIAEHLESRLSLDQPVNIHVTGCHNSCAQHYVGDIGLIGTKVDRGEDQDPVEGYNVFVGGGYGPEQGIGRNVRDNVPADEAPLLVERMLRKYLDRRQDEKETFRQFVDRTPHDELRDLFVGPVVNA